MDASKNFPSSELFDFACSLRWVDVPASARHAARLAILDNIGCMFGSSGTRLATDAVALMDALGGAPQASVIGQNLRTSIPYAAFLNSLQANALDYDDAFERDGKGMGHPGSTVIPTALAVAEREWASGADFVLAVIAGYEVANRIIEAIQATPARHAKVWGVAVHQAFGSAAAAARLLKLDRDAFHNALGLAGALSTMPAARKWNWKDRPLLTPKDVVAAPAEAGVRAALFAQIGWQGSRDILDGDSGFWIMAGSDRCDFARLTDRLGQRWTTQELSFKPYPACRWTHTSIEATEGLMADHGLSADDILSCEVGSFEDVVTNFDDRRPKTMIDAEFSLPWTLAVAMAGRPKGGAWYAAETLNDPAIHALVDRITFHVDEEAQCLHFSDERKTMAVVRLTTVNGRSFERRVAVARGGVVSPWPEGGIEAKFRAQVAPVLGEGAARDLQDAILALGDGVEFSALPPLLAARPV